MIKLRFDEFVATALRVLDDLHAPLLGVALDPVVIVAGNLAQDVATDGIDMAIDPEKPLRSGAIQEGLKTAVQEKAVETPVRELDAMLMMLEKGVHGDLQCGQIPGRLHP
jgi:hypothetical protein